MEGIKEKMKVNTFHRKNVYMNIVVRMVNTITEFSLTNMILNYSGRITYHFLKNTLVSYAKLLGKDSYDFYEFVVNSYCNEYNKHIELWNELVIVANNLGIKTHCQDVLKSLHDETIKNYPHENLIKDYVIKLCQDPESAFEKFIEDYRINLSEFKSNIVEFDKEMSKIISSKNGG